MMGLKKVNVKRKNSQCQQDLNKKRRKTETIVLPTRFLLGGNIADPLNLASFNGEVPQDTPKSSPLPTPKHKKEVEVLIPANIQDPLNLTGVLGTDSPIKSNKKNAPPGSRHKKNIRKADKQRPISQLACPDQQEQQQQQQLPAGDQTAAQSCPKERPQSGRKQKRYREKDKRFRYGNYDRYYQYRNVGQAPDVRMSSFKKEWFQGKEVLDIGCNAGALTIAVAKHMNPKVLIGIDIDDKLIREARLNVSRNVTPDPDVRFPESLILCHGPLMPVAATSSILFASTASTSSSTSPQSSNSDPRFPGNVFFATANYVLDRDELLESVSEEYDTILCLSVTKWIHLNWGDEGLQRMFKRIYRQLRSGGKLILEPQSWTSYVKKHSVCAETDANFRNIRFRPEKFTEYLLSKDVGFSTCELVDTPQNESKGFRRPIYCFTKN